jgi:two-component system, cell cycle sensor histidine kinase and response regulator CckA
MREVEAAEGAVLSADRRFRDLVEGIGAIVWEVDPTSLQFSYVSPAAEKILGYPPSRWLEQPDFLTRIVHPDDRELVARNWNIALREREDRQFEFRVFNARGGAVWLRDVIRVDADPLHVRGVMVDVTDRKDAEASLALLQRRSELILDAAAEGIYGLDLEGRATFVNPAGAHMLGWSIEEILGCRHHDLEHHSRADGTPYPIEDCPIFLSMQQGTTHSGADEVFWRKDGSCFPVSYTSTPIEEDGVVSGTVVTFEDITERTALEEQLRQSQKMDAVGQLAGGIAHDLNNLLTAILGNCELMFDDLLTEGARTSAKEIELTADMAAALVDQLLEFSRRRVREMQVFDLNEVVGSVKPMLRRVIREDIQIETRLGAAEARVKADRGQIEQVVLNLTINASDAMPDGGGVTIETANVDARRVPQQRAGHLLPSRDLVLLKVTDTGTGMEASTAQRIFEPFFTTKEREPGRGTGLGLATVYGIISQSGGRIFVESEPGRGTAFYVYLPRETSPANSDRARAPHQVIDHIGETILLVEDDHMVRSVAVRILSKRGYQVLEAANGNEALALSGSHSQAIDLLLTDIIMPEMSGSVLAEKIVRDRPSIAVLFISGYSEDALGPEGITEGNIDFLAKPFRPTDLAARVREVLDRRARTRG